MQLDKKYFLPTRGMKKLRATGYPCPKLTTFYRDEGQLFWPYGRNYAATEEVIFVQAADGLCAFIAGKKPYPPEVPRNLTDENIVTTCIVSVIPSAKLSDYQSGVFGALYFIADRHPSERVRIEAQQSKLGVLVEYLEQNPPTKPGSLEDCQEWIAQGIRLGQLQ